MIFLRTLLLNLAFLSLLVACGGRAEPPAASTSATAPPVEPTDPPEAVEQPPTVKVDLASLPAGVTPEGAFYLGNPDAPVTIDDYSNFL